MHTALTAESPAAELSEQTTLAEPTAELQAAAQQPVLTKIAAAEDKTSVAEDRIATEALHFAYKNTPLATAHIASATAHIAPATSPVPSVHATAPPYFSDY